MRPVGGLHAAKDVLRVAGASDSSAKEELIVGNRRECEQDTSRRFAQEGTGIEDYDVLITHEQHESSQIPPRCLSCDPVRQVRYSVHQVGAKSAFVCLR